MENDSWVYLSLFEFIFVEIIAFEFILFCLISFLLYVYIGEIFGSNHIYIYIYIIYACLHNCGGATACACIICSGATACARLCSGATACACIIDSGATACAPLCSGATACACIIYSGATACARLCSGATACVFPKNRLKYFLKYLFWRLRLTTTVAILPPAQWISGRPP